MKNIVTAVVYIAMLCLIFTCIIKAMDTEHRMQEEKTTTYLSETDFNPATR